MKSEVANVEGIYRGQTVTYTVYFVVYFVILQLLKKKTS